jgi:hypothetical protein
MTLEHRKRQGRRLLIPDAGPKSCLSVDTEPPSKCQ